MYQVIIVDDEQMVINSLALGFQWKEYGYEIAATCTSSTEALKMIAFIHPDVVFSDIRMPSLSGLELMRKIHESLPQIQFVFISGYADFKYTQEAIRLGACGYCLKPLENEEIEEALQKATKRLKERQLVVQAAFERLMQNPSPDCAHELLHLLYSGTDIPESLTILLSLGDSNSLLTGQVCYFSVKVDEQCYLYFISFNEEYLSSTLFQTTLLRSVAEGRIRAISWKHTTDAVGFLCRNLLNLFDEVYSYFVGKPVALGPVKPQMHSPSSEDYLQRISVHANKNHIKEVLDLLVQLPQYCPDIRPQEAVVLYQICTSLIDRSENAQSTQIIRYPYELARQFESLSGMLDVLRRKLEKLIGSANPDTVNNDTFREILEYINLNFAKPISFQDIAQQYEINPSYLSQLFKRELGVTFTSYLTNLRTQYAKELLENTTIRISEIPEKIGYKYDYNLAKLFKKETGYSPKEYRDRKRKK